MKEEIKNNNLQNLLIFINKVKFCGFEFNAPITADELVGQFRMKLKEEIKFCLENDRRWQQHRYDIRHGLF